jgi:hypothetical protein
MVLSTDSRFPNRRAYVVKLRSDSAPGALRGRLENLLTCDHREFNCGEELLQLIEGDLLAFCTSPKNKE